MSNKDVKRGIVLYIDGKQVKDDVSSIKAEIRKLTKELDHMAIGSREYNEQMAKIRNLNTILKQHKADIRAVNEEVNKTTFSFGKMVDGFNRFGGFVASLIASLTGLVLGLKALRDEKNKLEDSQKSLQALTGLDDSSVDWLTKQAQKLSTSVTKEGLRVRQSAAEILDAYMLVGSAKAELLGDKEALAAVTEEAMRLQAAAGDITLAEAVDAVTLSLNQFGAQSEDAARYVNVLAAGSKEGAANIASITASIKRAGVAAAGANVSVEETVALVETLAYKGITNEVAGTALKKFFLVLQTGADETNPKVVGLTTALENLKNKNMDAAAIKKMFGEEGYNAAAVILENIDMVNQLTEAVTGTNIAYEQSAINSDTASARLAQARNQMKLAGIELINKLNPAIMVSTNAMTYVVKILPGLIDWFREWGLVVAWLGLLLFTYTSRVKIATTITTAYHTVLKTGKMIQLAYATAMATVNGYTVTTITNMRTLLTGMGKHRVALAALRTMTYAYAAIVNVLRLRFDLAAKAMRGMFVASNIAKLASPWGILLAAVTAVTVALVAFRKKQEGLSAAQMSMEKINKKASEEYESQTAHIRQLNEILHNNKVGLNERKKALDELKSIIPDYNGMLDEEGRLTKDNTIAINDYLTALEKEIKLKAAKEELEEQYKKERQLEKEIRSAETNIDYAEEQFNYAVESKHQPSITSTAQVLGIERDKLQKLNEQLLQTKDSITAINEEIASASQLIVPTKTNPDDDNNGDGESDEERKKRINAELERLELEHGRRVAEIKKKYIEDDTMTQTEYNKLIQEAELQLLNDKLNVMGLEESKRQQLSERILDIQIKQREAVRQQMQDETKETLSANQKKLQLEAEQLANDYKNRLITREEFLKKLLELQKIYEMVGTTPETLTPAQQKMIDEYMAKIDEVIAKYREAGEKVKEWRKTTQENWDILNEYTSASFDEMTQIIATFFAKLSSKTVEGVSDFESLEESYKALGTMMFSYAQQFGTAFGEMLAGSEDSLKDFLKETVNMVLTAIEQLMVAYIAQTTMREVASLGFIGLAKAAGQIALITAAFETAKAAIGNFYTGGYTGSGEWDEPQGIVHSNEFVANRYAVANPAVRPVLDLIDSAQRTGTIANLSSEDIAAVAGTNAARSSGGVTQVLQMTSPQSDDGNKRTLRELVTVISLLKKRLDEPLEAYGVIGGRHGWKAKLDEYDQLLNNKSRNG